jgi:hypothetical protein
MRIHRGATTPARRGNGGPTARMAAGRAPQFHHPATILAALMVPRYWSPRPRRNLSTRLTDIGSATCSNWTECGRASPLTGTPTSAPAESHHSNSPLSGPLLFSRACHSDAPDGIGRRRPGVNPDKYCRDRPCGCAENVAREEISRDLPPLHSAPTRQSAARSDPCET